MNNKIKTSDRQKEIIINIYLNYPRLTVEQVHIKANTKFNELDLNSLSISQVRRIIQNIHRSVGSFNKPIEKYYEPLTIKYKSETNKKIWLIDDTCLDIMCYDDNNELIKPYLSIIMEIPSKKVINYQVGKGIDIKSRLELLTMAFKKSVSYPDIIRFNQSKINRNRKLLEGINKILKVAPDCKIQYGFHTSLGAQTERFFYHFNTQFLNISLILSTDQKTHGDTIGLSLSDLNEIVGHRVQNFNQSVENNAKQS